LPLTENSRAVRVKSAGLDWSGRMFRRPIHIVWLIYLIVGIFIAWERNYITVHLLKSVASALLAILLWWLVLLGVNLHIH
jgi:uncharacterized membrane protein YhaH (DUF805 family)